MEGKTAGRDRWLVGMRWRRVRTPRLRQRNDGTVLRPPPLNPHSKGGSPMMKIAFIAAAAVAVLTTAPVTTPVKAQGVDVQLGRDRDRDDGYRHRRDSDVTVGVGPGGITVGPRRNCRMVTTTVERDDGRMITRKERRCD
jgi:hypothetical protein